MSTRLIILLAVVCGLAAPVDAQILRAGGAVIADTAFISPVCNGVTNDTTVIQRALNSGAKRVVIAKAGTCQVTTLTIAAAVVLSGLSQTATILRSSGTPAIFVTVSASNVAFQDLTLNATGTTAVGVDVATGLSGITFLRTTVTGALGTTGATCVRMTSVSYVLIDASTFMQCANRQLFYTLTAGTTATSIQIRNSLFDGSTPATTTGAVEISTSAAGATGGLTGVHITDSTFLFDNRGASETDGLVLISGLSNGGFRDVTISGGRVSGATAASTTSYGIEMEGVTGFTIRGVTIENANIGIVTGNYPGMTTVGTGTVANNYITCGVGRTCGVGLYIYSTPVTVTGNTVEGAFTYGMSLLGANATVVGNSLIGQAAIGIQLAGNEQTVALNTIAGGGVGGSIAINIANNAAATQSIVRGNHFSNITYGVQFQNTTAANLVLTGNTFAATVGVNYTGTSSRAGIAISDDPGATRSLPIPTSTGCTATIGAGSSLDAGTYTSGTTGTCTVVITPNQVAPTGWACSAVNLTTPGNPQGQTASTTTTATIAGTTVTGDVVRYQCSRY